MKNGNKAMKNNEVDESKLTETVNIQYWTGLMYCGCGAVGGTVLVSVTPEEKAMLESAKDMKDYKFIEFLEEKMPAVLERIHEEAAYDMNVMMARDAMDSFDFDSEEFEGWSYDEKLDYVMDQSECSVNEICEFSYEFAE